MARARRLTLRYSTKKSRFTISVPKRASRKSIIEFVTAQQEWMRRQQDAVPKTLSILEQGSVMIEGLPRAIIHQSVPGVKIKLTHDQIFIACRPERMPRALQRFLLQHAENIITPLAHEKASAIGKKITGIRLRDTSSRWGSCSHDGNLSFSWRLILAPMDVIDYVVAHEVAHLQHFDHSPDFWGLCRELSASYTMGKHWLKLHGAALQQVQF